MTPSNLLAVHDMNVDRTIGVNLTCPNNGDGSHDDACISNNGDGGGSGFAHVGHLRGSRYCNVGRIKLIPRENGGLGNHGPLLTSAHTLCCNGVPPCDHGCAPYD